MGEIVDRFRFNKKGNRIRIIRKSRGINENNWFNLKNNEKQNREVIMSQVYFEDSYAGVAGQNDCTRMVHSTVQILYFTFSYHSMPKSSSSIRIGVPIHSVTDLRIPHYSFYIQ